MAEGALKKLGARIGSHPVFKRTDVVAEHPEYGLVVAEVEGTSSRQKEQALYSALGQLLLQVRESPLSLVLAVPNEPSWQRQVVKIPEIARKALHLYCLLVSEAAINKM